MALNLSGMLGDIGNLASGISMQNLIEQGALSTLVTVGIAGAQTSQGQDAIDFLHIFHKPATATTPATTGVVQGGKAMLMSQYLALSPDNQKMIQAMGYTIMPG
jgi:hypothetical protein